MCSGSSWSRRILMASRRWCLRLSGDATARGAMSSSALPSLVLKSVTTCVLTRGPLTCRAGTEDRPADLGAPLSLVGRVMPGHDVVLTDRPVDGQLMPGHVVGERAVGPVDSLVRAAVHDDGQFG